MAKKRGAANNSGVDNSGKGNSKQANPLSVNVTQEHINRLVQSSVDKAVSRMGGNPGPSPSGSPQKGNSFPKDRAQFHKAVTATLKRTLKGGAGTLGPETNPFSGGSVGKGTTKSKNGADQSFVYSVAHALTDAIFGETPSERMQRGHSVAESRAEKQIENVLLKNKGQEKKLENAMVSTAHSAGIPINPNVKMPRTKMKISLSRKRRSDTGQMNAVITLTGTDYLSDVTVAAASTQGTILYDTLIHPRAFPTTRIAAFAGLFDKYVYKRFTVRFNPSSPTTDGGIVVGFCDYDPDEDMVSAFQENVRKAASHFGMSFTQVFKPDSWSLKELKKDALFFCEPADSEDRLVFQGRYLLIQAADQDNDDFPAGIKGILTLDYEIDFYIPQLADTPVLTTNAVCEWNGDLTTETADIPFGTAPTVSSRSNININYAVRTFGGTARGCFTLPEVAVTTTWQIVMMYTAGTLTVPQLGAGNLVTPQTAFQSCLTNGVAWTAIYYYTQATTSSSGENLIIPYCTTFGGATIVRVSFVPLPTAISMQHNNRKELINEVDDLKAQVEEFKKQISDLVDNNSILPLEPPKKKFTTECNLQTDALVTTPVAQSANPTLERNLRLKQINRQL